MSAALSSYDRMTVLPFWRWVAIFLLATAVTGLALSLLPLSERGERVRRTSPRPRRFGRRSPRDRSVIFQSSGATPSQRIASGRPGVPLARPETGGSPSGDLPLRL